MLTRVATQHGTCLLVELADDDALAAALARLPEEEQAVARLLAGPRRRDFITGRAALHAAFDSRPQLSTDLSPAFLPDDRGAPVLPPGWVGSVSHKGPRAAALVAPDHVGWIGIDLELAAATRYDIARRILTAREQAQLPDRGRAVTLRFAIKEAIYKAIDPTLRRYVGFTEVELDLGPGDGTCTVTSDLPLVIEAAWTEHAGHWLATARATRRR